MKAAAVVLSAVAQPSAVTALDALSGLATTAHRRYTHWPAVTAGPDNAAAAALLAKAFAVNPAAPLAGAALPGMRGFPWSPIPSMALTHAMGRASPRQARSRSSCHPIVVSHRPMGISYQTSASARRVRVHWHKQPWLPDGGRYEWSADIGTDRAARRHVIQRWVPRSARRHR
jgi:hypothetical protein